MSPTAERSTPHVILIEKALWVTEVVFIGVKSITNAITGILNKKDSLLYKNAT